MLYLITMGRPNNYNNKYLLGADLIKKVDSILNESSSTENFYSYLNLKSQDMLDTSSNNMSTN